MGKRPRKSVAVGAVSKVPRGAELADAIRSKTFCWRLGEIDWEGPWGWSQASVEDPIRLVVPKLHDFESMTWAEMEGPSGSHSVEFSQLCTAAQGRLADIGKGELESLFSVRISGERRVWGVKDIAILRVGWWDPEHSVCPSAKKHT
jgi:hypothetical protein